MIEKAVLPKAIELLDRFPDNRLHPADRGRRIVETHRRSALNHSAPGNGSLRYLSDSLHNLPRDPNHPRRENYHCPIPIEADNGERNYV